MTTELAVVALGSNMDGPGGDSQWILTEAVRRLHAIEGIRVVRGSRLYRSAAVGGPPGQRDYLNGAVLIQTSLAARPLLHHLLAVEAGLGRQRDPAVRNAPRTLDLDLALYGNHIIDESGLHVPHPRLEERPFVVVPLHEVWPEAVNPRTGRAVASLVQSSSPAVVSVCGSLGVPQ